MFIYDDFVYNIEKKSVDDENFHCIKRNCKGKIVIGSTSEIKSLIEHNHPRDKRSVEKYKAFMIIIEKSLETRSLPSEIISNVVKLVEHDQIINMQLLKSLKNRVTKIRNKKLEGIISIFNDISDIFKKTLKNGDFLLYDSGIKDSDRFVIFHSNEQKIY